MAKQAEQYVLNNSQPIKGANDPYQTKKSRERMIREIVQITALMALLNDRFEFVVSKSAKKSLGCLMFPKILNVIQSEETIIDFDSFVESRFKQVCKKEVTTVRDETRIKRMTINNYLIDLANYEEMVVDAKATKKDDREQWDRIQEFVFDGKKLSWDRIVSISIKLNQLFTCVVLDPNQKSSFTVEKNWLYNKFKDLIEVTESCE